MDGKGFLLRKGLLLWAFLSNLCPLIDPATYELEIFFNSLFGERMCTTIVEQADFYARSKFRTIGPGMYAIDVMKHFSHTQHAHHNTWQLLNCHKNFHGLFYNYRISTEVKEKTTTC